MVVAAHVSDPIESTDKRSCSGIRGRHVLIDALLSQYQKTR
jgi:hypothetical protein